MPKITEFGSLAWSIYPCFQITLIDIHKKLIIYYKSEFIFFLTTFRFWKSICIFLLRLKKSCQNSWWPDLCRRRAGSPWKSSQVETTITGAVPDTCGSSVWTLRVGDSKISTWRKASELDQQLIIAPPPTQLIKSYQVLSGPPGKAMLLRREQACWWGRWHWPDRRFPWRWQCREGGSCHLSLGRLTTVRPIVPSSNNIRTLILNSFFKLETRGFLCHCSSYYSVC